MRLALILATAVLAIASASPQQQEFVPSLRSRSRALIPEFKFRGGSSRRLNPLRNNVQDIHQQNETSSNQPRVISKPQPGQEYVSFIKGDVQSQERKNNEIRVITDPIPGQEFVSFASQNTQPKDSVVSAKDGQLFYINLDKSHLQSLSEDTTYEPIPETEPIATTESPNYINDDYFTTISYDDSTAVDSSLKNDYLPQSDIEIITPNSDGRNQRISGNELYGKYFDESDLAFGKGENEEDKTLFPAESKVRSKFEIKEVNGQLYEYEYRYYYDDEVPEYDYDVVGNIPDIPSNHTTVNSIPTTVIPATTSTPMIKATISPLTKSPQVVSQTRGSTSFNRNRNRGENPRQPLIEENTIARTNSRGRSRGQSLTAASLSVAPSRISEPQRSRGIATGNIASNSVNSVDIANVRLPTQTRFPPRVTTSPVEIQSFGSVPFSDAAPTSNTDFFNNGQGTTESFDSYDEQSTTLSPATRSLMNLYALSQAAEAEESESSTVFSGLLDLGTQIPIDYDNYYDYDIASESSTDSTQSPDYFEYTTTQRPRTTRRTTTTTTTKPTTTTTTTTTAAPTPRTRTRGRFRNPLSRSRGRGSSRTQTTQSVTTTVVTEAPSKRGSSRIQSSSSASSGFIPSKSRFRPSNSRFSNKKNEASTAATENTAASSVTPPTTTRASSRGSSRRFSRPRLSFKPKSISKTETVITTKKPSESSTAATVGRGRLFNRFSRRRQQSSRKKSEITTASDVTEKGTTNVTEKGTTNLTEKGTTNVTKTEDTVASALSVTSTTTTATAVTRPSRNRSLGRRRFGRPSRLPVETAEAPKVETAEASIVEPASFIDENDLPESPQKTTPANLPRRPSRTRPSARFSSRLNLRNRGRGRSTEAPSTTTAAVVLEAVEENVAPESTLLNEEVPLDEAVVEEEEKTTPEPKGRNNNSKRRGSLFSRFRNRGSANNNVVTTTNAPSTTASTRRSGFSLLGRRNRGNRRNRVEEPEPAVVEEEPAHSDVILNDELVDNELAARGPQVELEVQASEDHIAILEPEPVAVAAPLQITETIEPVAPNPVKEKTGKSRRGGFSLLSRLRNRNKPSRQ